MARDRRSSEPVAGSEDPEDSDGKSRTRASDRMLPWMELCDFLVSYGFLRTADGRYQLATSVHHSQSDDTMRWAGVAREDLWIWIAERVARSVPQSQRETRGESSFCAAAEARRLSIEVLDVRVIEDGRRGASEVICRLNCAAAGDATPDDWFVELAWAALEDEQRSAGEIIGRSSIIHSQMRRLSGVLLSAEVSCLLPDPPPGRHRLIACVRAAPNGRIIACSFGPVRERPARTS
jgi:hypothetical protein